MKLDDFKINTKARDDGRRMEPVVGWGWFVRAMSYAPFIAEVIRLRSEPPYCDALLAGGKLREDAVNLTNKRAAAEHLVRTFEPLDDCEHTKPKVLEIFEDELFVHIWQRVLVFAGDPDNYLGQIPDAELGKSAPSSGGNEGTPATTKGKP